MIELAHVSKIYGKKQNQFAALEAINLTIESGRSVAIVGKSGSGKSTLMHVMSGLDRVSGGTITIDGQDISKLKNTALDQFRADKIGFIFQSFFVQANETCLQNVMLPLEINKTPRSERRRLALEALEQVELADKANTKAGNLSGGQKQRLAVARAIVSKPSIIFADEPTGNLDTATGGKVEELLFEFNSKLSSTLIIVTHDTDLAKKCDVQIYIQDGKIIKINDLAKKKGAKS
ncbi:MAG: ABC transporter ATP-binding protein [Candidatus Saccharimonadales bacterium]